MRPTLHKYNRHDHVIALVVDGQNSGCWSLDDGSESDTRSTAIHSSTCTSGGRKLFRDTNGWFKTKGRRNWPVAESFRAKTTFVACTAGLSFSLLLCLCTLIHTWSFRDWASPMVLLELPENIRGATGIEVGETRTPSEQASGAETSFSRLTLARQAPSRATKKMSLTCVQHS